MRVFHYFDNAATTRVRPEAAQAAVEAMTREWGNPSSVYAFGTGAAARVKQWRADVAGALGCESGELFFTSCGTESDNWAIRCGVELNRRKGKHIITTAIEHAAVLEPCRELERRGYEVTYLAPDHQGRIDPRQVREALRADTVLVSMMLVNNELGTVLPVQEAAKAIKAAGSPALLHCDAVQGFLKVPFTPKGLGVDLLSVSGHKIHAPKGIGALYIRKGLKLPPLIRGGGQESGLRSGTEATGQIAAFAAAARLGRESMEGELEHMARMKELTVRLLKEQVPGIRVLAEDGAPHILPVTIPVDDPVQLLHLQVQRVVYALGLLNGELLAAHQLVDIEPVAGRGGDPSGGGVGLFQQSQLRQVGHLVADGGGGHIQSGQLRHRLGAHRLGRGDIGLYNGAQDTFFSVCQFQAYRRLSDYLGLALIFPEC